LPVIERLLYHDVSGFGSRFQELKLSGLVLTSSGRRLTASNDHAHREYSRTSRIDNSWRHSNIAMMKPRALYEARARICKALAHPTRLLLLDALREEELCVGDLTELAEADQSTVSKHLAILKEAGFVAMKKKGSMSFYSVRCTCLDGFFQCIEAVLRDNLKAQTDLVQL